jgi:hypothetical protein
MHWLVRIPDEARYLRNSSIFYPAQPSLFEFPEVIEPKHSIVSCGVRLSPVSTSLYFSSNIAFSHISQRLPISSLAFITASTSGVSGITRAFFR